MGLDRGLGNAERLGDLANAADLDDGEQNAQLHKGKLVGLGEVNLQAPPDDDADIDLRPERSILREVRH